MAELIITAKGPMSRIVRSQRMFKGVKVGAIHDRGWLVMVRCDGGAWTPIHAIRKLAQRPTRLQAAWDALQSIPSYVERAGK